MKQENALREAIRQATDPRLTMRRILEQILALIPSAAGAAVEITDGAQLRHMCGAGSLAEHAGARLPLGASLSGLAVQTDQTLYAHDCSVDDRVDREFYAQLGARSMICVPLRRAREPLGVLKVCAREPAAFGPRDVEVLAKLARFMSAIVGASWDISTAAAQLLGRSTAGPARAAQTNGHAGAAGERTDDVDAFMANVLCPGMATSLRTRDQIVRAVAERQYTTLGQPVLDIWTGELIGVEALTRFHAEGLAGTEDTFRQARRLGLGVELELATAEAALGLLRRLPIHAFLAVNLSPETIGSPRLLRLLAHHPAQRIVIELTEHTQVDDYGDLRATLERVRALGTRLAIDDIGAGFANLAHILNLAPDLIKLDRAFSRRIDQDPARRAVAHSLISLARETGATLIAEGIERDTELETIRRLGFRYAQGNLIARPSELPELPARAPRPRATALRPALKLV